MFTGIITAVQPVLTCTYREDTFVVQIAKPKEWTLEEGESVTVQGVCSTIVESTQDSFTVEYMPETLRLTTMATLHAGIQVNLERSMRPQDLLSGYIVSGHIEGTGTITSIEKDGDESMLLEVSYPQEARDYFIHKGGVTMDGIALTVNQPTDTTFAVAIIPYTWEHTNLQYKKVGDAVNLEYDIIAKYVQRMIAGRTQAA